MLFEKLMDAFYSIITALLSWVNIPSFTGDIDYISDVIAMLVEMGSGILNFFVPSWATLSSFTIFLVSNAFLYGYYLVMWILKKIPMLGIK